MWVTKFAQVDKSALRTTPGFDGQTRQLHFTFCLSISITLKNFPHVIISDFVQLFVGTWINISLTSLLSITSIVWSSISIHIELFN